MWNPYEHAEAEGLTIMYAPIRQHGLYSEAHKTILLREGMPAVLERCTLAHELGHHAHADRRSTARAEARADRWAARRLITVDQIVGCALTYPDNPEKWCGELQVTPHMVRVWMSQRENYEAADAAYRAAV